MQQLHNSGWTSGHSHFNIPVEMAAYVLINRLTNCFETFLRMKFACNGTMNLKAMKQPEIMLIVNRKDFKTVQGHLEKLESLNWIGMKHNRKIYLRSFNTIRHQLEITTSTGFIFYPSNLDHLQATLFAAVVGSMLNVQGKVNWQLARKKRRADQNRQIPFPYFGIANSLIAETLDFSKATACKLKHDAEKIGLLETKHRYRKVKVKELDYRSKGASYIPEMDRLIYFKGSYYLQSYDEIKCNLTFRKRPFRKKLTHV
jgi:hypothetical protein